MTTLSNNDAARRAYWTEQMELGYAMVEKLIAFPVNECGEGFASLADAAAAANVEMQFSTSKIAGDLDRVFYMRESLVRDVVAIGRDMNERGWILKIEDGFDETLYAELAAAGHQVERIAGLSATMGHAGAIVRHADGRLEGATDPRSDGAVAAC